MCNTLIPVSRFISKASAVNGVSSPHFNAKFIEILKKDSPLLCND